MEDKNSKPRAFLYEEIATRKPKTDIVGKSVFAKTIEYCGKKGIMICPMQGLPCTVIENNFGLENEKYWTAEIVSYSENKVSLKNFKEIPLKEVNGTSFNQKLNDLTDPI